MDPLSTSLIAKLADLGGAGWIVAAILAVAVVVLYRELQKCQLARHSDVRELVSSMSSATQAVQAMTIAQDAVKRGQEEITRLIVENNRGQSDLLQRFIQSESNGNAHRELVLREIRAMVPAPRTGGRSR